MAGEWCACGIGRMRQRIPCWRLLRLRQESRNVGCGPTRTRYRRARGGREGGNNSVVILLAVECCKRSNRRCVPFSALKSKGLLWWPRRATCGLQISSYRHWANPARPIPTEQRRCRGPMMILGRLGLGCSGRSVVADQRFRRTVRGYELSLEFRLQGSRTISGSKIT